MNDLTGTVLLQRFRMDALERQDHLGDDYRSWDLKRNLPLLIKVLRAELPYDPALLSYQQGNMTLQSLHHPHIVPFYGLYQDHNISFMVEKYPDGVPLREDLLERRGLPYRTGDALIYLKALCLALAYAQGFGIVHCNVNPSNIWLDRSGNILLSGFGFARGVDSRITRAGLTGPPVYLAPEILRGQEVSSATDIYCLGVVLFELLTGQHPFLGPVGRSQAEIDADKIGVAHLTQTPPDPRKLNPAIPAGLSQVVATALAKNQRERYQSPQEMLEVTCAILGSSPEAIPDRFGEAKSGEETLIVQAPKPAQVAPAPPPRAAATAVVPPQAQPPSHAAPPAYPATQVLPAPPAGQGVPARVHVPSKAGAPPAASQPQGRSPSWPIMAGIGLAIAACLLVSGAVAYFFGQSLLQLPSAPTSTATLPPSATLPASAAPAGSIVSPTGQSQVMPPTDTPTPTNTPAPTNTPLPTTTPVPSDTPAPTPTRVQTAFTVTIRNNLSFPVYAFRDGQLMGTDPIPPRTYIFYRNIQTGPHTFTVCQTTTQSNCQEGRKVNVDRDLTVAFP